MKLGIDLVKNSDLKQRLDGGLENVFTDSELASGQDKLPGIFAAKEAFFKALGRKEDWLKVWLGHESSGKPVLHSVLLEADEKTEVSISYAGDYVTAIVVIIKT